MLKQGLVVTTKSFDYLKKQNWPQILLNILKLQWITLFYANKNGNQCKWACDL